MFGTPTPVRPERAAHLQLVRRREETIYGEPCPWCGKPARYRYGTEDNRRPGRICWDETRHCSLACRDANVN